MAYTDSDSDADADMESALCDLVAIVRDQQLGYPDSELHTPPTHALQDALDALEANGVNTDEIVFPADKESLGLS